MICFWEQTFRLVLLKYGPRCVSEWKCLYYSGLNGSKRGFFFQQELFSIVSFSGDCVAVLPKGHIAIFYKGVLAQMPYNKKYALFQRKHLPL